MQVDTSSATGSGIPAILTCDDKVRPIVGDYMEWVDVNLGRHLVLVRWVKLYPTAAANGSVAAMGCESSSPPPPPPP